MANPLVAPQIQKAQMEQSNRLMDSAMNRMGIGSSMINKAITDTGQLYQDYRDAQYLNALNQYSNDPIGMSNALSSGSINARGVSRDTLNKVPEYLQNYSTAWKQNTETEDTRYMNDQNLQFSKEKALYNDLMKTGNANEAMKVAQDAIGRGANVRLFTQDPNYMRQQIASQNYGHSIYAQGLQDKRMQDLASGYAQLLLRTFGNNIKGAFDENGQLTPAAINIISPEHRSISGLTPLIYLHLGQIAESGATGSQLLADATKQVQQPKDEASTVQLFQNATDGKQPR